VIAADVRPGVGVADRAVTTRKQVPRGGLFAMGLALTAVVLSVTLAAPAVAAAEPESPTPTSEACPRVIFYFSRGSGQSLNRGERGVSSPGVQVFDDLAKRYEPSVVGSMSDAYTAVALTFSIGGLSLPNPLIPAPYFASVANGVQVSDQNVADLTVLCPRSWLVLGGYSQGAEVTREALAKLGESERQHVAAVVLFGDPFFSASEPNVSTLSSFDPHQVGLLRQLPVATPAPVAVAYSGKIFSWCHLHDVVCQGIHFGNGWSAHKTYAEDAEDAASRIAGRLAAVGLPPGLFAGAARPSVYLVRGTCLSGTCALAQWSGPGTSSFKPVGAVYEGQEVAIACQTQGQAMTGPSGRSSAIWDRLGDGAFVSDLYLTTPDVGQFSAPLPRCQALTVGTP
jgi:hypothetical protein